MAPLASTISRVSTTSLLPAISNYNLKTLIIDNYIECTIVARYPNQNVSLCSWSLLAHTLTHLQRKHHSDQVPLHSVVCHNQNAKIENHYDDIEILATCFLKRRAFLMHNIPTISKY